MKKKEFENHLKNCIIPFWKSMRDDVNGGYYGYKGYDLVIDKESIKGCILNSRILWFFSNAYKVLKNDPIADSLLDESNHAYDFMTKKERRCPQILNASRRKRIAAGSGTTVQDVNTLMKQYDQTSQMMKRFTKGGFKLPKGLGAMGGFPGGKFPGMGGFPGGKKGWF